MPARAAALALLAVALPAAAAPAARGPSPAARSLVRRCVEAYGGQAALARAAAVVHEGSVTSIMHPGRAGRIGRAYGRPGRLRVELSYPGESGEIRVLDGGRGWRDGREVIGPPLHAMMLQAARLDLPSLLSEWIERVEERGTLRHDGKTLRVLALAVAPGIEVEAALDPGTGRILRSRGVTTEGPKVEFVTTYSDFRPVDGVLVPFREGNWANGKVTGETVLERVVFVPAHPAELFRP